MRDFLLQAAFEQSGFQLCPFVAKRIVAYAGRQKTPRLKRVAPDLVDRRWRRKFHRGTAIRPLRRYFYGKPW